MKRIRIYVIFGTVLLLSMSLFVGSGWANERDVLSFLSLEDRTRPIILMDTQGKILQELVIPDLTQLSLSWAPDGRSFTYHAIHSQVPNLDFDIYVMDVETQTSRRLTLDGGLDIWPTWSPNGKWISFASNRSGTSDLYRVDVAGGNLIKLTDGHDYDKTAWSPDSQSIAFSASKKDEIIGSRIYVMSAEGKELKQLTDTSSGVCTWSPDGKEIAYIPPGDAVGGVALFSIDINGKNMRQLTRLYEGMTLITSPVWSPRGKWIAYILSETPEALVERLLEGERIPADEVFANAVLCIANTENVGGGEPIEMPRGLVPGHLEWMPAEFLSVSPSAQKQITLWGRIKELENATK